jgi:hypothetical protein
MIKKFNNIVRITFLAILCIMVLIPTSMGGVNGNLYLIPIDGTYNIGDSWDDETYVTNFGDFYLNVSNHAPQISKSVYFLYILTAVNMDPDPANSSVVVTINGTPITSWTAANSSKPTFPTTDQYQYPTTIYKSGTWYNITTINLSDNPLRPGENMTIPIYTDGPSDAKIHFDGAGADEKNKAILTVPSSHDAMSQIPEFPTIALPIAAILGLMFILHSRRRKED